MVYKLVDLENIPRIKLSEEVAKVTLPCKKGIYRIFEKKENSPSFDLLTLADESINEGEIIIAREFLDEKIKIELKPEKIERILNCVWDGKLIQSLPSLDESRTFCEKQIANFSQNVLDALKPKKYNIYLSEKLYQITWKMIHELRKD